MPWMLLLIGLLCAPLHAATIPRYDNGDNQHAINRPDD